MIKQTLPHFFIIGKNERFWYRILRKTPKNKCMYYGIIILKNLKSLKIFLRNAAIFALIFIFVYIIFAAFTICSFSHVNELTNADAVIILGASVWDNSPSPVFQERINHGIWLYKNNFVKHLIFTGGIGKHSNISEASVAMDYAIKNHVPAEKIFIEEQSSITLENFFYAKEIIDKEGFNKIIVVSDPLHMKRSITIAKDYGLNAYSSPTPTTKYISWKTKSGFLLYETFFYIAYNIYKHSSVIILFLITFEFLFLVYYYNTFRA